MHQPPRKPVQLRLRTLLFITAIIAAICAVGMNFGGYTLLMGGLFVAAILAHVVGNAMGTRLRDEGTRRADIASGGQQSQKQISEKAFVPTTHLEQRRSLGWTVIIITAVGAVVGGGLGGYALAVLYAGRSTLSSTLVGVLAFAIIGGFFAYLAGSFVQVSVSATRQAQSSPKRERNSEP